MEFPSCSPRENAVECIGFYIMKLFDQSCLIFGMEKTEYSQTSERTQRELYSIPPGRA